MSLPDWLRAGWLVEHQTSPGEIHYRTIQSLAHTIGADPALVLEFDQYRKKRNMGGYERAGLISDHEARGMVALATRLRADVEQWLRRQHPKLLT